METKWAVTTKCNKCGGTEWGFRGNGIKSLMDIYVVLRHNNLHKGRMTRLLCGGIIYNLEGETGFICPNCAKREGI